jgi:hypothetical protein
MSFGREAASAVWGSSERERAMSLSLGSIDKKIESTEHSGQQ